MRRVIAMALALRKNPEPISCTSTSPGSVPPSLMGSTALAQTHSMASGLFHGTKDPRENGHSPGKGRKSCLTLTVIRIHHTLRCPTRFLPTRLRFRPHHSIWLLPTPQPARARWLTPISHAKHTWGVGEDVLVAHHGLVEHAMTIVPHRRMQSLSLHQGPLQRRLRLATVAVHTTDGPVSLRVYHLDQAVARQLFDEQLARGRDARAAVVAV